MFSPPNLQLMEKVFLKCFLNAANWFRNFAAFNVAFNTPLHSQPPKSMSLLY